MLENITTFAPAKINLGLRVMKPRADGFHNISSIFTTVNLCDEITVSLTNKKNTCQVVCESFDSGKKFDLPEENTLTKAYKAFCVLTGIDSGVCVKIKKRIPAGGGLGGGSSDASSFIYSLNLLLSTHLAKSAQMEIAGKVGSDCFFFTSSLCEQEKCDNINYTAYVEGRGEIVSQIESRNDYTVLLLMPGVSVSTKEAYSLVDKFYDVNTTSNNQFLVAEKSVFEEVYKLPVKDWEKSMLFNDFTKPISGAYPAINEALIAMKNAGADFVDMSGSGSTIYGIFEDRRMAESARDLLTGNWQTVLV